MHKSVFLFGPRQTGKSLLATHVLSETTMVIDLLDPATLLRFSQTPSLLQQEVKRAGAEGQIVMIDEVQKLPSLLDEVHLLIEKKRCRFLLTGSSLRKLKLEANTINLLGGRARERFLHPFSWSELQDKFDLRRAVNVGLLPSIYFSDDARADLQSYVGTYLSIEIAQEARLRKLDAFSRFLKIAAICSGQIINYKNVANDAKVPARTVAEYFGILYDTRFCHEVPSWKKGRKRKAFETSKYYFFDNGVAHAISGKPTVNEGSSDFGDAFEAYIFHEIKTYLDYKQIGLPMTYWRSTSGFEVDFLIGDDVAIEVKGKRNIAQRDLSGLKALSEEGGFRRLILVCLEDSARRISLPKSAGKSTPEIEILPWQEFLTQLWSQQVARQNDDL